MFKKILLVIGLQLFASMAMAATQDCGLNNFDGIYVADARGDAAAQSNKLFIVLNANDVSACHSAGITFGYIDNTSKSYNTILSLAAMAYATGVKIHIVVDDTTKMAGINADGSLTTDSQTQAARIEGFSFQ